MIDRVLNCKFAIHQTVIYDLQHYKVQFITCELIDSFLKGKYVDVCHFSSTLIVFLKHNLQWGTIICEGKFVTISYLSKSRSTNWNRTIDQSEQRIMINANLCH